MWVMPMPLKRVAVIVAAASVALAGLAARGKSLAAFDGRCLPGACGAPPSSTAGILSRRALPAPGVPAARVVRGGVEGRLTRLDATPDFHHGLLAADAQSPTDWPAVAGDPGGMKYSPADQITPANVARLTQAWTYQSAGSAPIVI